MPAGKIRATGGRVRRLTYAISLSSIARVSGRDGLSGSTRREIRELRQALRDAVRWYSAAGPEAATTTEIHRRLQPVVVAARRLRNSPSSDTWAKRLNVALADAARRPIVNKQVHRAARGGLMEAGNLRELSDLRRHLGLGARQLTELDRVTISRLAAMNPEVGVPDPGAKRFGHQASCSDPEAVDLLLRLLPIWERVTGRKAGPRGEEKSTPVMPWLQHIGPLIGRDPTSMWNFADFWARFGHLHRQKLRK